MSVEPLLAQNSLEDVSESEEEVYRPPTLVRGGSWMDRHPLRYHEDPLSFDASHSPRMPRSPRRGSYLVRRHALPQELSESSDETTEDEDEDVREHPKHYETLTELFTDYAIAYPLHESHEEPEQVVEESEAAEEYDPHVQEQEQEQEQARVYESDYGSIVSAKSFDMLHSPEREHPFSPLRQKSVNFEMEEMSTLLPKKSRKSLRVRFREVRHTWFSEFNCSRESWTLCFHDFRRGYMENTNWVVAVKMLAMVAVIITSTLVFSQEVEDTTNAQIAGIAFGSSMVSAVDPKLGITSIELIVDSVPTLSDVHYSLLLELQATKCPSSSWRTVESRLIEVLNATQTLVSFEVLEGCSKSEYQLAISTPSVTPIAISMQVSTRTWLENYQVVLAAGVLVIVYSLIILEVIHRTIVAMFGSFLAVALLSVIQDRPSLQEVVLWADFDTMILLFSMMIIVGVFSTTGVFEWAGVQAFKLAKGDMWVLTLLLCILVTVLSALLDNVTTILLLTPVTVRLCHALDLNAVPILVSEVMLANIAGVGIVFADPPTAIVASNQKMQQSGISFASLLIHVGPGTFLSILSIFWYTRYRLKDSLTRSPFRRMEREIEAWKHTAHSVDPTEGPAEWLVQQKLFLYIEELEAQLQEANLKPSDEALPTQEALEKTYTITNMSLCIHTALVLLVTIILFFISSLINLTIPWIALSCALFLLFTAASSRQTFVGALRKVDFATLIFFTGLFIMIEALTKLGLMSWLANKIVSVVNLVDGGAQLFVAVTILLWVSAIISSFVDAIPLVASMVPVVQQLSVNSNLPIAPLVYALLFGACMGNNATMIANSASMVAVGMATNNGCQISFKEFAKIGVPTSLMTCFVTYIYLIITQVVIGWY